MTTRIEWATATFAMPYLLQRGDEADDGQNVTAELALDFGPFVIEGTCDELLAMVERARVLLRLEYLRGELRAERISMGEIVELQSLAEHIPADDVELREAAGIPEHEED